MSETRAAGASTSMAEQPPATRYRVAHRTVYEYNAPVTLCHNQAMLLIRACPGQEVRSSRLVVTPHAGDLRTHIDAFGNLVSAFSLDEAHTTLDVFATSEVDVTALPVPEDVGPWEASMIGAQRADGPVPDPLLREFALPSPLVPSLEALADYAAPSFAPGRPMLDAVLDLTHRIFVDFTFDSGFTTVATPVSAVLDHRRGVCQDFAQLAVGALRAQGLAARYVSGYLETTPPPGVPKLVGADASHAWCSVWIEGHGWLDLDPTNDHIPSGRHITAAWGRDYADVTPLKGVIFAGGTGHHLRVEVDVTRV